MKFLPSVSVWPSWFPWEVLVASFLVGLSPFPTLCCSTSLTHFTTNCPKDHPHCQHLKGINSILYISFPKCPAQLLLPTRQKVINRQANNTYDPWSFYRCHRGDKHTHLFPIHLWLLGDNKITCQLSSSCGGWAGGENQFIKLVKVDQSLHLNCYSSSSTRR